MPSLSESVKMWKQNVNKIPLYLLESTGPQCKRAHHRPCEPPSWCLPGQPCSLCQAPHRIRSQRESLFITTQTPADVNNSMFMTPTRFSLHRKAKSKSKDTQLSNTGVLSPLWIVSASRLSEADTPLCAGERHHHRREDLPVQRVLGGQCELHRPAPGEGG